GSKGAAGDWACELRSSEGSDGKAGGARPDCFAVPAPGGGSGSGRKLRGDYQAECCDPGEFAGEDLDCAGADGKGRQAEDSGGVLRSCLGQGDLAVEQLGLKDGCDSIGVSGRPALKSSAWAFGDRAQHGCAEG